MVDILTSKARHLLRSSSMLYDVEVFMLISSTPITEIQTCEECYEEYKMWIHDSHAACVSCRRMRALERIAEALETWIGWQ